jgi:two-component system, LuxR family, response regulator FixJ
MPGCTGVELLRRIRAAGSSLPFILASGQDLEPFRAELERDPAVCLLPKPFSMAALVDRIKGFAAD